MALDHLGKLVYHRDVIIINNYINGSGKLVIYMEILK